RFSRDWSSDVCSSDLQTAFWQNQADVGLFRSEAFGAGGPGGLPSRSAGQGGAGGISRNVANIFTAANSKRRVAKHLTLLPQRRGGRKSVVEGKSVTTG